MQRRATVSTTALNGTSLICSPFLLLMIANPFSVHEWAFIIFQLPYPNPWAHYFVGAST
jgi:predicted metalloenzyme YecM